MTDKPERKDYPPYLDYPRPRVPMTNGDKIRAMTDQGLAYWMCHKVNLDCDDCPGKKLCAPENGLANGLVAWLKQEAKE